MPSASDPGDSNAMYCTSCGSPSNDAAGFCTACGASLSTGGAIPSGPVRFRYHGDGGTLLGIVFVNFLLSIVTLGIYSFWGRIKVRKYVMESTELQGERFLFHGTGLELLIGAAKAFALMLGIYCTAAVVAFGVRDAMGVILAATIMIGALIAIWPLIVVGSRKYRSSRTSYRNIRFSFRGTMSECAQIFYPGILLTIVTLGFYYPIFANNMARFIYSNTWYGSIKLEYDGDGHPMLSSFALCLVLTLFTFGYSLIWWQAEWEKHIRRHTSVLGSRLNSAVDGPGMCLLHFTNSLLVIFTLGIAFTWAETRKFRYYLDNLSIEGPLNLDVVHQQALPETAIGEGMGIVLEHDGFFDLAF